MLIYSSLALSVRYSVYGKKKVTPSELRNNEKIKEILTQTDTILVPKTISQPDLMIKKCFFRN